MRPWEKISQNFSFKFRLSLLTAGSVGPAEYRAALFEISGPGQADKARKSRGEF